MTPGFHWTLRPSVKEDDPVLKAFPAELPLLVKQLLLQRGFTGGTETELFLEPRLSHLSDPFLMGEMRVAVDRIFRAVDEGDKTAYSGVPEKAHGPHQGSSSGHGRGKVFHKTGK